MSIYSDLNMVDPQTRPYVLDAEAVVQHLSNILSTNKAERLFRPDLGIEFRGILFELLDDPTIQLIQSELFQEIQTQDYRVVMNYQLTQMEPYHADHILDVTLAFGILGIDDDTFEFRGLLER